MPGAHNGQKFIGFWVNPELDRKINSARNGLGRSQWVRERIEEMLKDMGYEVPRSEVCSPDRIGKGGPRKAASHDLSLNETPPPYGQTAVPGPGVNSSGPSRDERILESVQSAEPGRPPGSPPRREAGGPSAQVLPPSSGAGPASKVPPGAPTPAPKSHAAGGKKTGS